MNPASEQPTPAPQGRARHSVRADGSETDAANDNRGARRTGAPCQTGSDEQTGLPGFRTWRSVYIFVAVTFILWVVLLLALTLGYS